MKDKILYDINKRTSAEWTVIRKLSLELSKDYIEIEEELISYDTFNDRNHLDDLTCSKSIYSKNGLQYTKDEENAFKEYLIICTSSILERNSKIFSSLSEKGREAIISRAYKATINQDSKRNITKSQLVITSFIKNCYEIVSNLEIKSVK